LILPIRYEQSCTATWTPSWLRSFSQEAILISCAALLSAYFGGVQLADLDRTRVYEIPASYMTQMSVVERTTAKACAARHGIRYKIIQPGQTVANAQN
jgi:hypothetical protein